METAARVVEAAMAAAAWVEAAMAAAVAAASVEAEMAAAVAAAALEKVAVDLETGRTRGLGTTSRRAARPESRRACGR